MERGWDPLRAIGYSGGETCAFLFCATARLPIELGLFACRTVQLLPAENLPARRFAIRSLSAEWPPVQISEAENELRGQC